MDINQEIQKATDAFIESKLPEILKDKVGKMVDDILGDIFRSYSNTGKEIKEKIERALNVNLQEFDLVDYNHFVSKAINDRLVSLVNTQAIKPILELVDSTVGFLEKKEWKLSEIHQLVIDEAREYYNYESEGEISFFVEEDSKYKWHTVYLDIEKGKSQKDCGLEFLINEGGKIFIFRAKSFWSEKNQLTPAKVTQLSNMEHKIFRLYSAQAKILVNQKYDFDNYWYNHD